LTVKFGGATPERGIADLNAERKMPCRSAPSSGRRRPTIPASQYLWRIYQKQNAKNDDGDSGCGQLREAGFIK
jgi:hypothetical protein